MTKFSQEFMQAAQNLANISTRINTLHADLAPVELSGRRKQYLFDALVALGKSCGIQLDRPLQINAQGDVMLNTTGAYVGKVCFSEEFAALTRAHQLITRCGVNHFGRRGVSPTENWCFVNHFELERFITAVWKEAKPPQDGLTHVYARRATLRQIVDRMVAGETVGEYELDSAMNELQRAAVDAYVEAERIP